MTYNLNKLNSVQRKLLVFIAGALANLAFAPFDFFPVLLLSFPLFFEIMRSAESSKQAFWLGWWFGFGHFLAGLYWISNSLLVDADKFAWLIPFAMAGIPSVLAIYIGLAALLHRKISNKLHLEKIPQILLFINLWILTELARNYLFTGFPWNLLGYSLLFSLPLAQIAAYGGVFLASFVALYIAFLPLFCAQRKIFFSLVALVCALYLFGAYRIDNSQMQAVNKTVNLIQPNTQQTLSWNEEVARKNFQSSLDLMKSAKESDYYIWPEATGVYHLNRSEMAVETVTSILPDGSFAIIGADRSLGSSYSDYQVWNSMYVISKRGVAAIYDKQHLVPFGEYVPLSDILPLEKITYGMMDFSSGQGEKIINQDGISILPLICYEVIFTDFVISSRAEVERPAFIVNITNDAWFGDSTGPYQHLAMTRMRAIESGLPVLRAAKSGISAITDSFGKIINKLGLNQKGVVFSDIPDRLEKPTFYSLNGFLIIFIFLLSISIIITFFLRRK